MSPGIKSYVLRSGRLSPRQEQGLIEYLPHYQLPEEPALWDFSNLFQREAKTIVEIGFGMGASLLTMAQEAPELNFIGIEVHRAGIGSLAADLYEKGVTNVRIAPYDAVSVFQHQLRPHSLEGVQIFFPDPWPKARHHKRRLIQADFLQQLVASIRVGGFIHCATDWAHYAEQMLAVLSKNPALINQSTHAAGYVSCPEHASTTDKEGVLWARRPLTKFERRGQLLGHGVWDLFFTRVES